MLKGQILIVLGVIQVGDQCDNTGKIEKSRYLISPNQIDS
jgi:hypothetical protein